MPDKNQPPEARNKAVQIAKDKETPNDVIKAHHEAEDDISKDPDWNAESPNDDLDEGESARLGEDTSGII